MRILYVNQGGDVQQLTDLAQLPPVDSLAPTDLLWVDLYHQGSDGQTETAQIEALLTQRFGFHPLAIDDALNETHVPKVDDWETYLYIVLRDIIYTGTDAPIALPELDLFLGKRYLITYHAGETTAVDRVWAHCLKNQRWLQHGADYLLYRLIDEIVNDFTAVLETLESDILRLESSLFDRPTPELLETLSAYKRIMLQIRRILTPQQNVVSRLARDPYPVIGAKDRVYFQDVYDHLVRLTGLSDSVRELVMGNMEIYLSVVNNRMNNIMRILTIITTLFMPLTFLTGFFGMNFFQAVLPSTFWTSLPMLVVVLSVMVLLPLLMFGWMRRYAWL